MAYNDYYKRASIILERIVGVVGTGHEIAEKEGSGVMENKESDDEVLKQILDKEPREKTSSKNPEKKNIIKQLKFIKPKTQRRKTFAWSFAAAASVALGLGKSRDEEQRKNWRDLSPAREVTLRCLRQQRRRRDRGVAPIVADAHVLSNVGDFIGNVLDGHGSESIEHDQER
nr:hypothetical protein CFP56_17947 [Quercus suber]